MGPVRQCGYADVATAVPGPVGLQDARVSFITPFVMSELEVALGRMYVDFTPITPALAGIATQWRGVTDALLSQ